VVSGAIADPVELVGHRAPEVRAEARPGADAQRDAGRLKQRGVDADLLVILRHALGNAHDVTVALGD